MATPTPSRPGRPLAVIAVVIVALVGWMVITGHNTPKLGPRPAGRHQRHAASPRRPPAAAPITNDQINEAVEIIRQRVNGLGVAEAEVTTQGQGANATVVVSIPGKSLSDVAEQIGQTAQLNFRPVNQAGSGTVVPVGEPLAVGQRVTEPVEVRQQVPEPLRVRLPCRRPRPPPARRRPARRARPTHVAPPSGLTADANTAAAKQAPTTAALQPEYDAIDCSDPANTTGFQDNPDLALVTCDRDGAIKYLLEKAAALGTNIDGAQATLNPQSLSGEWSVNIDFDAEGTKAIAALTKDLIDNPAPTNQFAIVLDGLVVSAPVVQGAIIDGNAQITGSFTQEEAETLANQLKYGALPLAFDIGEVSQISPTLGSDQLRAGLLAGALGLFLVVLYSLLYYRGLGIVTVASLTVAGILTYSLIVLLGEQVGLHADPRRYRRNDRRHRYHRRLVHRLLRTPA